MPTAIDRLVDLCRRGELPQMICAMPSGWAVMGEKQFLRGYCLLIPDPVVPHLNDMHSGLADSFLSDMRKIGDAVLAETGAIRINYAIFSNLEPVLHGHIIPRFENEPPSLATATPWSYDWSVAEPYSEASYGLLRSALEDRLRT